MKRVERLKICCFTSSMHRFYFILRSCVVDGHGDNRQHLIMHASFVHCLLPTVEYACECVLFNIVPVIEAALHLL
jgi:hypothetical protein